MCNCVYMHPGLVQAVLGLTIVLFLYLHFLFPSSDAPVFVGSLRNASLLAEIATGSNQSLICTVVDYQGPSPLSLNLTTEPNDVPDLKYNMTNTSSITVTITNASQKDVSAYVCHACCGEQTKYCSFLGFDTYVGGEKQALYTTSHPWLGGEKLAVRR